MLNTKGLIHQYAKTQRFVFPDLNCNNSETLLVLGQSGVGKTTLLHILGGILKPQKGLVNINGKNVYALSPSAKDTFRGRHIGIVFQKPHFISALTAEENIYIAQTMAGLKKSKKDVADILTKLNLIDRKSAKINNMSQGELQRLSLARALINKPNVILADEPTSALDDVNCDEVINLLTKHSEEAEAALVIVTHDNRLKEKFSNQVTLNQSS